MWSQRLPPTSVWRYGLMVYLAHIHVMANSICLHTGHVRERGESCDGVSPTVSAVGMRDPNAPSAGTHIRTRSPGMWIGVHDGSLGVRGAPGGGLGGGLEIGVVRHEP